MICSACGRQWRHPITGDPARFGFSTIERWYYRALKERRDPVGVLRRKLRTDAGQQPAMSEAVRQAVLAQYAAHKSWSIQLHHDNLVALAETRSVLKPAPSYATLRRLARHPAPDHAALQPPAHSLPCDEDDREFPVRRGELALKIKAALPRQSPRRGPGRSRRPADPT